MQSTIVPPLRQTCLVKGQTTERLSRTDVDLDFSSNTSSASSTSHSLRLPMRHSSNHTSSTRYTYTAAFTLTLTAILHIFLSALADSSMSPPYSPVLDFSLLHGHADAGFTPWEWYEDQLSCSVSEVLFICALGLTVVGIVGLRLARAWQAKTRRIDGLSKANAEQRDLIRNLEAQVTELHLQSAAMGNAATSVGTPANLEGAHEKPYTGSIPLPSDLVPLRDDFTARDGNPTFQPVADVSAGAQANLAGAADTHIDAPTCLAVTTNTALTGDLIPDDTPPWVGEATDDMLSLLEAANPSKPQRLLFPSTHEEAETYAPDYADYDVDSTPIAFSKGIKTRSGIPLSTKRRDTLYSHKNDAAVTLRVEDRVCQAATGVPRGWTQKDQERAMQVAVVEPEKGETKSLGVGLEDSGEQKWESSSEEESEGGEGSEGEGRDEEAPWKLEG
ncbi:hypothetical protein LTR95_003972 [Oleoguttula sp. CCFEE 5521]